MKLLIDILHPAHVHIFKNLIRELEAEGHEVHLTMREKDCSRDLLEQYGFSANQTGKDVVTNCPTLLAAPAIERSIGLELVENIEFSNGPRNGTS